MENGGKEGRKLKVNEGISKKLGRRNGDKKEGTERKAKRGVWRQIRKERNGSER